MIGWRNPSALIGLLAIAAPILVHLLRRQRAEILSFPSVRFLAIGSTSSFRFRPPEDISLLFIRVAIVGVAAIALAEPFVISASRKRTWNARLSRAVVLDSNVSALPQGKEAAAAASQGADLALPFTSTTLSAGLNDALDAISGAPPSRREIVLISDFRLGTLTSTDVASVPAGTGLRFININTSSVTAEFRGDTTSSAPGIPARVQEIRLTQANTAVEFSTTGERPGGLRVETTPHRATLLLRAVAAAGAPSANPAEPIALAFDRPSIAQGEPLAPWMLRTVLRMRNDAVLADAARNHVPDARVTELPGAPVVRGAQDAVVVSAVRRGPELVLFVAAAPEHFLAAVALQSALAARRGTPAWNDREVARIRQSQLDAWARAPELPDIRDMPVPPPGDGRVVWAFALVLLVVETLLRRRRENAGHRRYADAA